MDKKTDAADSEVNSICAPRSRNQSADFLYRWNEMTQHTVKQLLKLCLTSHSGYAKSRCPEDFYRVGW